MYVLAMAELFMGMEVVLRMSMSTRGYLHETSAGRLGNDVNTLFIEFEFIDVIAYIKKYSRRTRASTKNVFDTYNLNVLDSR